MEPEAVDNHELAEAMGLPLAIASLVAQYLFPPTKMVVSRQEE